MLYSKRPISAEFLIDALTMQCGKYDEYSKNRGKCLMDKEYITLCVSRECLDKILEAMHLSYSVEGGSVPFDRELVPFERFIMNGLEEFVTEMALKVSEK